MMNGWRWATLSRWTQVEQAYLAALARQSTTVAVEKVWRGYAWARHQQAGQPTRAGAEEDH